MQPSVFFLFALALSVIHHLHERIYQKHHQGRAKKTSCSFTSCCDRRLKQTRFQCIASLRSLVHFQYHCCGIDSAYDYRDSLVPASCCSLTNATSCTIEQVGQSGTPGCFRSLANGTIFWGAIFVIAELSLCLLAVSRSSVQRSSPMHSL